MDEGKNWTQFELHPSLKKAQQDYAQNSSADEKRAKGRTAHHIRDTRIWHRPRPAPYNQSASPSVKVAFAARASAGALNMKCSEIQTCRITQKRPIKSQVSWSKGR